MQPIIKGVKVVVQIHLIQDEKSEMRLSPEDHRVILEKVEQVCGEGATVTLFGSRVNDDEKGGDIDIMVSVNKPLENPAYIAAMTSAKIMRTLQGRKVDVILLAPNLQYLPIHDMAKRQGIKL